MLSFSFFLFFMVEVAVWWFSFFADEGSLFYTPPSRVSSFPHPPYGAGGRLWPFVPNLHDDFFSAMIFSAGLLVFFDLDEVPEDRARFSFLSPLLQASPPLPPPPDDELFVASARPELLLPFSLVFWGSFFFGASRSRRLSRRSASLVFFP